MLFYVHCEAWENATTHGILDQRYPFRHDIAGRLFMVIWNNSISKHVDLSIAYIFFFTLYTPRPVAFVQLRWDDLLVRQES